MKILFLDCDGVLNCQLGWSRDNPQTGVYFSPENLELFKNLLEACPDVKIVISSTWRYAMPIEAFRVMFDASKLPGNRIIGYTVMRLSRGIRGYEIKQWLDDHAENGGEPIESFVIVDDMNIGGPPEMKEHLVKTTFLRGLEDEHVNEIIRRFNEK